MVRDAAQRLGMTKAVLTRDSIEAAVTAQIKFAQSEGLSHEELVRKSSGLKEAGETLTQFLDTINALDLDGLKKPALKLAGMLNDSLERHTLSQADYLDVSNAFQIALRRRELETHEACGEFIKKHRLLPKESDPGLTPPTCTRIDDSTGAVWEAARQTAAKLRTIYRVRPAIVKNLIPFKVNEKSLRLNLQRLARLSGDSFLSARGMIVEQTLKLATGRTNKLFGLAKRLRKRHRMRVDGRALKRARSDKIKMLSGGHFEESGSTRQEENRVEMKEMAQRMAKTGTSSPKEALKKANILTSEERTKMNIMQMAPKKRPDKILEWNKNHPKDLIKARDVVKSMPIEAALDLMLTCQMPTTWRVVGGWEYAKLNGVNGEATNKDDLHAQLNGVNGEATNMDDLPSWKRSREGDHYAELECEPTEEVREFIEGLIFALQRHNAEQAAFSVPCVDFTENYAVEAAHVLVWDMTLRRRVLEAIEIHFSQLYYCRNARFSSIGSSHGEITEGDDMPPKQHHSKGKGKKSAVVELREAAQLVVAEVQAKKDVAEEKKKEVVKSIQKIYSNAELSCKNFFFATQVDDFSSLVPTQFLRRCDVEWGEYKRNDLPFITPVNMLTSTLLKNLLPKRGNDEGTGGNDGSSTDAPDDDDSSTDASVSTDSEASWHRVRGDYELPPHAYQSPGTIIGGAMRGLFSYAARSAMSLGAGAVRRVSQASSSIKSIVPSGGTHLMNQGEKKISELTELILASVNNVPKSYEAGGALARGIQQASETGYTIYRVSIIPCMNPASNAPQDECDESGELIKRKYEDVRTFSDQKTDLVALPHLITYEVECITVKPIQISNLMTYSNLHWAVTAKYHSADAEEPIDYNRVQDRFRMPTDFSKSSVDTAVTSTMLAMRSCSGINHPGKDNATRGVGLLFVHCYVLGKGAKHCIPHHHIAQDAMPLNGAPPRRK